MPVEYKVIIKPDITDTPSGQLSKEGMRKFAKDLEDGLNNMGNEGWRLVTCYGLIGRYFIFARET
jgi:hypothetical protein